MGLLDDIRGAMKSVPHAQTLQPKPAQTGARTSVTPVVLGKTLKETTACSDVPEGVAPVATVATVAVATARDANSLVSARWRVHFSDSDPLEVSCAPAASHAQMLESYPQAVAIEPVAAPAGRALPAEMLALLAQCEAANLADPGEHGIWAAMYASAPAETEQMLHEMAASITWCTRCQRFSRPGQSDGYCGGRSVLRLAYGLLRQLPPDRGLTCPLWAKGFE